MTPASSTCPFSLSCLLKGCLRCCLIHRLLFLGGPTYWVCFLSQTKHFKMFITISHWKLEFWNLLFFSYLCCFPLLCKTDRKYFHFWKFIWSPILKQNIFFFHFPFCLLFCILDLVALFAFKTERYLWHFVAVFDLLRPSGHSLFLSNPFWHPFRKLCSVKQWNQMTRLKSMATCHFHHLINLFYSRPLRNTWYRAEADTY